MYDLLIIKEMSLVWLILFDPFIPTGYLRAVFFCLIYFITCYLTVLGLGWDLHLNVKRSTYNKAICSTAMLFYISWCTKYGSFGTIVTKLCFITIADVANMVNFEQKLKDEGKKNISQLM